MKLVICDPNLERASGHHWFLDSAIATEAQARGIATTLVTHQSFAPQKLGDTQIHPHFSATCYARRSQHPVSGAHEDFCHFNDLLHEELSSLPMEWFSTDTLVLFPTVTERHLYGLVRWIKDFPATLAPTFVVYLMLPSGIELAPEEACGYRVLEPLAALHYRMAFDLARGPGPQVHFCGTGLTHAREFSLLADLPVAPHPVVLSGMSEQPDALPRTDTRPTGVLYLGDAKEDKGFALLPELLPALCQRHPDWRWRVHANCGHAWGEVTAVQQQLLALAQTLENFEFHDGYLSTPAYAQLLAEADLVAAPYSPEEYHRKSSGVAWEAIWRGLPCVVPAGTWLEDEVALWHGAAEPFQPWTAPALGAALDRLVQRLPEAQAQAAQAAQEFRRRNSVRLLFNQLGDVWAARMALGAVARLSTSVSLTLDKLSPKGWHYLESSGGRPMRWSRQQMDIEVDLDPDAAWRFQFEGGSLMGEDQVMRAVLTADGRPVQMQAEVHPEGSPVRWRLQGVIGASPSRTRPTRLVLTLPYAYRPEGEGRDLGLLFSAPLRFVRSMGAQVPVTIERPLVEFEAGQAERETHDGDVGYRIGRWACASVMADPTQALEIVGEVPIDVPAHTLVCSANGQPARLQAYPVSPLRQRVIWHVPPTVVRQGGPRVSLMLSCSHPPGIALYNAYGRPAMASATGESIAPIGAQMAGLHLGSAPLLPASGLLNFGQGQARPYLREGWSGDEDGHVWMNRNRASLVLRLPEPPPATGLALTLDTLSPPGMDALGGRLGVYINTRLAGILPASQERQTHTLNIPAAWLGPEAELHLDFSADMSARPPGEERDLCFAFFALSLSPQPV